MSDSDDENEGVVSLTGFLFGNVDTKTGKLEEDVLGLGSDAQKQLRALEKLGFGSVEDIIEEDDDEVDGDATSLLDKRRVKVKESNKVASYESESEEEEVTTEDEDDDDDEESRSKSKPGNSRSRGSQPSIGSVDDEDYDDVKSPTACDFSDISELAEDEEIIAKVLRTRTMNDDDTDYDFDADDDTRKMPPPPTPVKGHLADSSSGSTSEEASGGSNITNSSEKKLETPLAAMLPSKYAGVSVTTLFPDFRPDKVLRFSRLFGPGKSSSLPQTWRNVRKRRKKKRVLAEGQAAADLADEKDREKRGWDPIYADTPDDSLCVLDSEILYLEKSEIQKAAESASRKDKGEGKQRLPASIWRHGPAELWYDMLGVTEDDHNFDYGFKKVQTVDSDDDNQDEEDNSDNESSCNTFTAIPFPDEAFHMVTQLDWEENIIWDSHDAKTKKLTKSKAAGWVPSGVNRTAQNLVKSDQSVLSGTPTKGSGTAGGLPFSSSTTSSPSTKSQKAAAGKNEEGGLSGQQGDDTWYSIFPVETEELVYGRWEDEVIWDIEAMEKVPEPTILSLDPNDENVILCIPDDIDPSAAQGKMAPVKVKIPHPHVKKSKILLGKAGVINVIEEDSPPPSPKNDDKDPYNISNDEYYQPKHTEQSLMKISPTGNIIQHSTPVVELRAPFIPTHMGPLKLRNFHRLPLKRYSHGPVSTPGPHAVMPLAKHILKKAKQRELERLSAGGGDIFFMRTPEDFSGKDGELMLIEYCEEHPPLLNQVGMCSKIKNYYKRKAGKDTGPPDGKYGDLTYAHTSPFLGAMHPGQMIQTIENNMYRAPIYIHPMPETDFIVIRTRNNFFIREFDAIFTGGQECPLYEVPGPNSKRANNFVRDFLQVFIYRLFWKSRDNPKRIRMDDIKRAFPMHSESSIRKRLKLCADFKRTGTDSNWWVIKPEFRLPTEEEIRATVSPEQCCAYFSLIAAEQRLKDAGYGEKFLFTPQDDDDEDNQGKIDDEVKTAPWNTTRAYIQAMKGKCLLQLTGPADPTGLGEGFSYIRVPNKPQTSKEEQASQPKRIVTGTDADLRRLSLNNAKVILRKFGVPEEEIQKLSRWEVIDVVRTLSTEKAKVGEEGMNKFSRGNRFSVAEHQERYKEECQRIFELQNRVLMSSEVLSTDEGESSEEELSDIEEMGKNIENMLSNKKTSSQLNHEKEEQERRELQKMIMGEGKDDKDDEKQSKKTKRKDQDKVDEDNNNLAGLMSHPGRVLKIHRKFKSSDGKEYTRTEIVRKPHIIDIYMRIRTTKDEQFIRQFALLDDTAKEEMKKEKRRIQEQLRRIKRNQEKETVKPPPQRKKKIKMKPELKMKCGACGQVGHMRTNKACPLYEKNNSPIPSMNVAMTEEQEEEIEKELITDDGDEELVKVDGTKVQLSGKLFKQADEIKRRSLLIKVPKEAVIVPKSRKKRLTSNNPHCDYLSRKEKITNRRRIDPLVVICNIFEDTLSDMRNFPDSHHFHYPVSQKIPKYYDVIKNPMDLTTMRDKIRQKEYQTRADFLYDVKLIVQNSITYNGEKHLVTAYAQQVYEVAEQKLKENDGKLSRLEKLINPLLDENYKRRLIYILNKVMEKLKILPEASAFLKPVNKKTVKNYYEEIEKPMDLETIENKIRDGEYQSRYDFLAHMDLIHMNAIQFNGPEHQITAKAFYMAEFARAILKEFDEHLTHLEVKIQKAGQGKSSQDDDNDSLGGGYDDLSMTGMDGEQDDGDEDYSTGYQQGETEELDPYFKIESGQGQEEEEDGEYISEDERSMTKQVSVSANFMRELQPRGMSQSHSQSSQHLGSGFSLSSTSDQLETEGHDRTTVPFDTRGLSFEEDSSSGRKRSHYEQYAEHEPWNTNSDDEGVSLSKRRRQQTGNSSNLDDESQQAIEAMMELSQTMSAPQRSNEYGASGSSSSRAQRNDSYYHRPGIDVDPLSVQNIHADLEVSDSDNEDDTLQKNYDIPPRQDGSWF